MSDQWWGYGEKNGPDHWHEQFPVAKEGKRQSPVDICTKAAETCDKLLPLVVKYSAEAIVDVENTGASWKVNAKGPNTSLKGGPLDGEYELWQFHAHWGKDITCGSEHTVDGKMYPAELHLVHWNKKYASPNEATAHPDGLAVLGIFLEVGSSPNTEVDKLCTALKQIKYKSAKVKFSEPGLDPTNFLPASSKDNKLEYWTYEGSLTTPPLLESVIWIVLKKSMQVSEEQLSIMRQLLNCPEKDVSDGGATAENFIVDNFRPPVPLGERKLRQL